MVGARVEWLKVLSLGYVLEAGVLHSFQHTVDGLPLRVKDGALRRDVTIRLHAGRLRTRRESHRRTELDPGPPIVHWLPQPPAASFAKA